MSDQKPHRYNQAGRLLQAAIMAYRLGIGLDYALKKYVPEVVSPYWTDLAEKILKDISEQIGSKVMSKKPTVEPGNIQ